MPMTSGNTNADADLVERYLAGDMTAFDELMIRYERQVYTLPKALDEKVAALHLAKVGAKLTKLSPQQAEYIGVSAAGPFKHDLYRY